LSKHGFPVVCIRDLLAGRATTASSNDGWSWGLSPFDLLTMTNYVDRDGECRLTGLKYCYSMFRLGEVCTVRPSMRRTLRSELALQPDNHMVKLGRMIDGWRTMLRESIV